MGFTSFPAISEHSLDNRLVMDEFPNACSVTLPVYEQMLGNRTSSKYSLFVYRGFGYWDYELDLSPINAASPLIACPISATINHPMVIIAHARMAKLRPMINQTTATTNRVMTKNISGRYFIVSDNQV